MSIDLYDMTPKWYATIYGSRHDMSMIARVGFDVDGTGTPCDDPPTPIQQRLYDAAIDSHPLDEADSDSDFAAIFALESMTDVLVLHAILSKTIPNLDRKPHARIVGVTCDSGVAECRVHATLGIEHYGPRTVCTYNIEGKLAQMSDLEEARDAIARAIEGRK